MIPKKIHYFWIGGNPKPKSVLFCIESWKKYCPDYEIIEWNETNYDFTKNEYMKQAYEAKKWAFVTDYARLDVIYRYGGIYLDTDVELIKPLDQMLDYAGFMGFDKTTGKDHYVATGLGFGMEPGNGLIKEMMADYEDVKRNKESGEIKYVPCPYLNTQVLRRYGLENADRDQLIQNIMIFASDVFCPKSYNTLQVHITDRTLSIHHFDGTWQDNRSKRRHRMTAGINRLFGEKTGSKIDRGLGNIEYCIKTAQNKLKHRQ